MLFLLGLETLVLKTQKLLRQAGADSVWGGRLVPVASHAGGDAACRACQPKPAPPRNYNCPFPPWAGRWRWSRILPRIVRVRLSTGVFLAGVFLAGLVLNREYRITAHTRLDRISEDCIVA